MVEELWLCVGGGGEQSWGLLDQPPGWWLMVEELWLCVGSGGEQSWGLLDQPPGPAAVGPSLDQGRTPTHHPMSEKNDLTKISIIIVWAPDCYKCNAYQVNLSLMSCENCFLQGQQKI